VGYAHRNSPDLFMATSYQADAQGEAAILQLVERAMVLVEGRRKEA
jgi:hypothetical protein